MRPCLAYGGFFATWAFISALGGPALAEDESAHVEVAHGQAAQVTVILRADDPHATIAGVATWTPECIAPCEARLDPKFTYRVAGDGLVPSDSFVLPRDGDPL